MPGPTTHISSLASLHKQFRIQMIDPVDLFYAVDCSTDLWESVYGETEEIRCRVMDEQFGALLDRKYENCTEWYLTNLATLGVQEPVVVIVRWDDGRWQMDEGHHRLSWALRHSIPLIPVIFDDSGADDESHMGFMVARANVDAYHSTVTEEFLVPLAAEKLFEEPHALPSRMEKGKTFEGTASVFIPPRDETQKRGRHRAK
jgi:hypothetical protein